MMRIRGRKAISTLVFFAKDFISLALGYVLSELIFSNTKVVFDKEALLYGGIFILIPFALFAFIKSHRTVWKYTGFSDAFRIGVQYLITFILLTIFKYIFNFDYSVGQAVLFCYFSLTFSLVTRYYGPVFSFVRRRFADSLSSKTPENIIVFGAGFTGAAVIKRFLSNPDDGFNPVAVIDDDTSKKGSLIMGIEVEGAREILPQIMKKHKAKTVVIAITKINREEMRSIYNYAASLGADVKVVGDIVNAESVLKNGEIKLKDVRIEDLLRRKEHTVDKGLLDSLIKGKVVLVTGGAGSIGSEICRQALEYGASRLIIFDHHENGMFEIGEELHKKYGKEKTTLVIGSVKDREKFQRTLESTSPQIVFHAAAYKHVPMMEINADEAVKNNVMGSINVIEECSRFGVEKFILISTDKAVNPSSVMGATKRIAEMVLESEAKKKEVKTIFAAVRFGNVLGSSGSVIPTFLKQINEGGPVTVTDRNMKRYFMTIPEAVRLVNQAGALAEGGEVFILDMGEPVYIYDLATDLIRLSRLEPNKDIEIKITGLRAGEKLFEELVLDGESVNKTSHKGIFVCKLEEMKGEELKVNLKRLVKAAEEGDTKEAEQIIFNIVPATYRKI